MTEFFNLTQDWNNSNSTKTRISFTHTSLVIFSSDRGQDKLHVLANFATNHQLSFAWFIEQIGDFTKVS